MALVAYLIKQHDARDDSHPRLLIARHWAALSDGSSGAMRGTRTYQSHNESNGGFSFSMAGHERPFLILVIGRNGFEADWISDPSDSFYGHQEGETLSVAYWSILDRPCCQLGLLKRHPARHGNAE